MTTDFQKTLPAGEYYIGDPCYVMPTRDWNQWMDDHMCATNGQWVIHPTHCGDGWFIGSDGFEYHVDSGNLGMVLSSLCDPQKRTSVEQIGTFHAYTTDVVFSVYKHPTFTEFWFSDTKGDDVIKIITQ
jgi:hypothetical protein